MPASTTRPRWYVVHCKAREDRRALEHLERQGFECYRPTFTVEKRRLGRKVDRQEPLFPRYLFIRLSEIGSNWYPIRSTRGVSQLVRCNEKPVAVSDAIIEGIRTRMTRHPEKEPFLQPGERVRITDGAFSQLEAIFLANDGEERVILLLNILQQDQRLSFPVDSVRKVRESNVA